MAALPLAPLRLTGALLAGILPPVLPQQAAFKANAAEFGRQGQAALQAKREAHAARLRSAANGDEFQAESLARVRELLTDTFERLRKAQDPKDRELLSRSLSHLAEVERRLAGRPLPGTRGTRSPASLAPPSPGLPQPR